jgi:uncharacterized membrane protein
MSEQPFGGSEITSDDKLWVLLTYLLSPIIPIVILLMEDKKNRPFIRAHNAQALILGIINVVVGLFFWTVVAPCINLALFVYLIYLAIKGYQGEYVTVPVITDFVKKQGWA